MTSARLVTVSLLLLYVFLSARIAPSDAQCNDACCNVPCSRRQQFTTGATRYDGNAVLTSVYNAPDDMAASDTFYGNGAIADDDSDCAHVHSITRDEAAGVFRINITLKADGRGCNKTIPWTLAPRQDGQTVHGSDALTFCNTSSGGCTRISAGPLKGLSVVIPPPVYRAPLTSPQNSLSDKPVPFGYSGYHVYETESKGTCTKYGFEGVNSGIAAVYRKSGPLGVALAVPRENECGGTVPQQGAFVSRFSPKRVAQRLAAYLYFPRRNNNMTTYVPDVIEMQLNNTAYLDARVSLPFGYLDVASLMGVLEPFTCGANVSESNSTFKLGSVSNEAHSCPMTPTEWEAVLQDVAIEGVNVDEIIGPNSTAYSTFQRDGGWIVPTDTLGTVPPICYRCSSVRSEGLSGDLAVTNYASRHMPMAMSFGPQCAGLSVENSRERTRVALGGYVGISSTDDRHDGAWRTSAGFPVRYARAFGDTLRHNRVTAPGTSTSTLNATLRWHDGTNGQALRFDMSALRYVLCNGGGASLMRAGTNTTSGAHIGPLVSEMRAANATDLGPAWPNPFRWVSLPGLPDCAGCTYPTLASQKGWTVMNAQMWHFGQHNSVGGFHSDHSLWSRVLALVNGTEGLFEDGDYNLFAKWNVTAQMPNAYAEAARALNQSEVLPGVLDELSALGIPGIGQFSWVTSMCDYLKHNGKPTPGGTEARDTQGTTATPFCWLLRRQLYAQSEARVSRSAESASATANLPDLGSATRTGIFNVLAPNIWFGTWQREVQNGDSQWQVFMDDTWDRVGRSIFGDDGMASAAQGSMHIDVPISSVETLNGPTVFNATLDGSDCGNVQFFSPFSQKFGAQLAFSSASSSVVSLRLTFTPYNCEGTVTYNTTGATLSTSPYHVNFESVFLGNPDPRTGQSPIIMDVPYDTVDLTVTYDITFPFVCTIPRDTSEQFGFSLDVLYEQYISPTEAEFNSVTEDAIVGVCEQANPAATLLQQASAFDMSIFAPPYDLLPQFSVCAPVYTANPLLGGYSFTDDNSTVVFNEAAKQYITYVCESYATVFNPNLSVICNVTGDGRRSGDCTFYEDNYEPQCTQFWKLSCTPWNDAQIVFFLFVLFLFVTVVFIVIFSLIVCTSSPYKRTYSEHYARMAQQEDEDMGVVNRAVIDSGYLTNHLKSRSQRSNYFSY